MHLLTAACDALLALELLQQLFMLCVLLHLRLDTLKRCFIRIHKDLAGVAVNSHQLAVIFLANAAARADNRRNAYRACENRRVRVHAAGRRHKALHTRLIQLHRFAGSKVVSRQNIAALAALPAAAAVAQAIEHLARNILDIRSTRTHIIILHRGKNLSKVSRRRLHCILCIDMLRADNSFNGLDIIKILQHHLMNLKNRRIISAYVNNRLFIKHCQLSNRLLTRCLKACNLSLCIQHLTALYCCCLTLQYSQRAQRYAAANALAF